MPPTHRLVIRFTTTPLLADRSIRTPRCPTSENYGIDAQYNLIEIATNKSVMTGTTFSRVSYDIPGQLAALRPRPRLARRRGSRRPGDRREHPDPARVLFRRRHLIVAVIPGAREARIRNRAFSIRSLRIRMTQADTVCIMVALRGKEIDSFLARPDPGRPIILLYGPDAGLVRERADALLASAVDDPNDPFSLVRLDGDELAAEPSRLVDEAMTIPLFGGRRAIRVRAGSRSFASGIDTLAEIAAEGLPHRDRGRRAAAANRRCARPASAPRPRSRSPAIPTASATLRN